MMKRHIRILDKVTSSFSLLPMDYIANDRKSSLPQPDHLRMPKVRMTEAGATDDYFMASQ